MMQELTITDDYSSCNHCRVGKNQIFNHSVQDNKLVNCVTICTQCRHQEEWKDGKYTNEGKCIKVVEYKSTEVEVS